MNIKLRVLLIVLIMAVIPVTVYLVKQRQIFQPKAAVKSKLSMQTAWQKSGAMEFIETAKPVVVKLLGGYERVGEIKQKSPATFIIGRIWEQNQPGDGDPNTRAQEWFDRNRGALGMDNIDCWEGYNEHAVWNGDEMTWYSNFEIKRMQLLESIGKKACIGNFSVGHPDYPLWSNFRGAMDWARDHGHFLGLHEYGPTSMSDRSGDFSLRHRKIYQDNGFSTPLFITETGIDENGNQDTGGWRTHTNAGDYMNQLKWYDDRLQEDSYVRGATIFSYGLYGWASFEIYPELVGSDGRSGPLTQYIAGGEGGGGPTPTTGPTPTGGPTPTSASCQAITSYGSPNPVLGGGTIIFTFTSNRGYTNVGITPGDSTTCGSVTTSMNGFGLRTGQYGWRWTCTAGGSAGNFNTTFTSSQNCSATKAYTITTTLISTTPTPTLRPTVTVTPTVKPTNTPVPTKTLTPTPTKIIQRGDINGDGKVNFDDMVILILRWGQNAPTGDRADLNNNGKVDYPDYAILMGTLGY